jgi:hypothetical protein
MMYVTCSVDTLYNIIVLMLFGENTIYKEPRHITVSSILLLCLTWNQILYSVTSSTAVNLCSHIRATVQVPQTFNMTEKLCFSYFKAIFLHIRDNYYLRVSLLIRLLLYTDQLLFYVVLMANATQ